MNSERVVVSAIELATYLDVTPSTVADLAAKGRAVRVARGKYDLQASIRAYVRHLREAAAGRPSTREELTAEKTRLTKAQADARELENRVKEGRLLDADEVTSVWSDKCVKFRRHMLALSGQVAMLLPHLTRFDVSQVDRAVRDALTNFVDAEIGPDAEGVAVAAEAG